MRNLRNIRFDIWRSPEDYAIRPVTAVAWDSGSRDVILTYGPSEEDTLVELVRASRNTTGTSGEE